MAIAPVGPSGWSSAAEAIRQTAQAPSGELPFANVIKNLLGQANMHQMQADQAVQELATGQTDNLHHVMLSVAKADLSFRMVLEVRNRLADALQEIMRMQI